MNMTETVNWALLLIGMAIGAIIAGPTGFVVANGLRWWAKKKAHLSHVGSLLKIAGVAVLGFVGLTLFGLNSIGLI